MKKFIFLSLLIIVFVLPSHANAARLATIGYETASSTGEWTSSADSPTFNTTTVRSGTYSVEMNLADGAQKGFEYTLSNIGSPGPYYLRTYVNYTTLPSSGNTILVVSDQTSFSGMASSPLESIQLNSNGSYTLYVGATPIGTSGATSAGTWHRVEMLYDFNNSLATALLDGVQFASINTSLVTTAKALFVTGNGINEGQTQGDFFFDDFALNDNTGGNQNSYPGDGHVIRLKPNAAGDANAWTTQVGGTAGSANNFTRVNEITPNSATSYNGDKVVNHVDMYNVDDSGIGRNDTINLVQINVWYSTNSTVGNTESTFRVRAEKTSSGTVSQGTSIKPNSLAWLLNTNGIPETPSLTMYVDPDGNAWTKKNLDSMQIGMGISTGNNNLDWISNVWANVEYIPNTPPMVLIQQGTVLLLSSVMLIQ